MAGIAQLPTSTVLTGRYQVERVLGRGGFSIAYLAIDLSTEKYCVVKELCPVGATRVADELDLTSIPHSNRSRLISRFLDEANILSKVRVEGIPAVLDAFEERGTAYYVTDYIQGVTTLEKVIAQEGRLSADATLDILLPLLETLEQVHAKKILHRDIKPTNILLSPKGKVFLIDFGAAREWHADTAVQHTVLFTPGYAPLEQMSESGRRGPATDIYAVCATAYHMLTGYPPRSSAERADGTEMIPLTRVRTDLEKPLVDAIEAGLQVRFSDRPQSVSDLKRILLRPDIEPSKASKIEAFDAAADKLRTFGFAKRECPSCGGLLDEPRPLKKGICPVCHTGKISVRKLSERACPSCQTGILHRHEGSPALFCPHCRKGRLETRRKGLLSKVQVSRCTSCSAEFEGDGTSASMIQPTSSGTQTWAEWITVSGRSRVAWICDLCDSAYDVLQDGRWRSGSGDVYHPTEWARIAAGLPPNAGNAYCEGCSADYWLEDGKITLLHYGNDPYGYGEEYVGRAISVEDVPMLAIGKRSGQAGLICQSCKTEFDIDGKFLHLACSSNRLLAPHQGRSYVLDDWHRIAQGLPLTGDEPEFFARFDAALLLAYEQGELPFDDRHRETLWTGNARKLELEDGEWVEVATGPFTITEAEIVFGRGFRKWRVPFTSVLAVGTERDILEFRISGDASPHSFLLDAAVLHVRLRSGNREVTPDASSVAKLLQRRVKSRPSVQV